MIKGKGMKEAHAQHGRDILAQLKQWRRVYNPNKKTRHKESMV
jgi:hypothetical protein